VQFAPHPAAQGREDDLVLLHARLPRNVSLTSAAA